MSHSKPLAFIVGFIVLILAGTSPWWPFPPLFETKIPGQRFSPGAAAGSPKKKLNFSSIPGTRVSLLKPTGFVMAKHFPGLQQASTGASIMVTEIPGPYSEVTKGVTAEQMKSRGMNLQSKEDATIDGRPGLLLSLTQIAYGKTYAKWISIIGDEKNTVIITATFPKDRESDLSTPLRDVVLSVKWEKSKKVDPFADLRFTIAPSDQMEFVKRVGKTLLYSKDGLFPAKSPEHPIFIVGYAVSTLQARDKRQFAQSRFLRSAGAKNVPIETTEQVTIDRLPGYKIVGSAQHSKTGIPILLYQVFLFDEDTYVIMSGRTGARFRKESLRGFGAMARTFMRKR